MNESGEASGGWDAAAAAAVCGCVGPLVGVGLRARPRSCLHVRSARQKRNTRHGKKQHATILTPERRRPSHCIRLTHLSPAMDVGTLPPVTRIWAIGCVAVSLLEHVSVISSYSLFYSPALVFNLTRPQPYRVITSFLYFGEFGIDFIFHLFFFIRYARMLEENHYVGHTADFAWLVVVCGSLLLALGPLITPPIPFLGSPLAFVMVYVWSRRNRHIRLSLFGILVITAPYLPIALCAFSWMITGSAGAVKGDLLGLAVGHVCECARKILNVLASSPLTNSPHCSPARADYFLADVWPKEVRSGGRQVLKTPRWL